MCITAWIGNPYFCESMVEQDMEIFHIPLEADRFLHWEDVVQACGAPPDIAILGDNSLPPFLADIEAWPCLTVFHCVDSHIHSWHPFYAQAFDLCSVSLKDNIPYFSMRLPTGRVHWTPPWAPNNFGPRDTPKEWDVLFAGNVHPEKTPKRHTFLSHLKTRFPALHITKGDFGKLFPKARIVLNYCEMGDLNFRVFEALGTGSCLATPDVGHGQEELFTAGTDLFTYNIEDMDGLVALLEQLLEDESARDHAAQNGLAKIDAEHRESHRAEEYARWIRSFNAQAIVRERLELKAEIHRKVLKFLYLHFAKQESIPALREAYTALALKG